MDKADSAHALAVLQTQRPPQPDAGGLCLAVHTSGCCPKHTNVVPLAYYLRGYSMSARTFGAVPLLMVSRPLPRVLLIHTGGTLGKNSHECPL